MPNAGHQARQTAEARYERTLFAVACMPLLGMEYAPASQCSSATVELHMTRGLPTHQHVCLWTVRWSQGFLCGVTDNRCTMTLSTRTKIFIHCLYSTFR